MSVVSGVHPSPVRDPGIESFRCPACLGGLSLRGSRLFCSACGEIGGFSEGGMVRFGTELRSTDDSLSGRLARTLAAARSQEEADGLFRSAPIGELNPTLTLMSPFYQAAWKYFLPGKNENVLCIDADLGSTVLAVAPDVRRVYALHADRESAEALLRRAEWAGIRNLTVCVSSGQSRLPFADGAFDAVAVQGYGKVAERALGGSSSGFLKECRRVLKADGVLYAGGRKEGWLCRGSFSAFSLASGLSAAGFARREVVRYWESGGYSYKAGIVGRGEAPSKALKSLASAYVAPGQIGMLARNTGEERKSVLEGILGQLSARFPGTHPEAMELHVGSGGVFRFQTRGHIVRIPMDEIGFARGRNNHRALSELRRLDLSFRAPLNVLEGTESGQAFFVETRLPGREIPYSRLSRRELASFGGRAARMLLELQRGTEKRPVLDRELFDRLFARPLDELSTYLDAEARERSAAFLESVEKRFLGESLRLVRGHGDFKITNLLSDGRRGVAGLVDWDLSDAEALPGADLVFYKGFEKSLLERRSFSRAMCEAAFGAPDADIVVYLRESGLKIEEFRVHAVTALVHYFNRCCDAAHKLNAEWNQRNLSAVMAEACRRAAE